jgi:multisubunit Na+/H+ antiporter MnhC subunit
MLRLRSFPVILGLTFLSYAVNLFIFASGRLAPAPRRSSAPPTRRPTRCRRRWS